MWLEASSHFNWCLQLLWKPKVLLLPPPDLPAIIKTTWYQLSPLQIAKTCYLPIFWIDVTVFKQSVLFTIEKVSRWWWYWINRSVAKGNFHGKLFVWKKLEVELDCLQQCWFYLRSSRYVKNGFKVASCKALFLSIKRWFWLLLKQRLLSLS